jgi:hypothetical protein
MPWPQVGEPAVPAVHEFDVFPETNPLAASPGNTEM